MANTSGKQLSVGVRRAVIFQIDADGFPLAAGTQPYEGFEVIGPKAFTLTIADSRKISHVGNDRVLAIDYLPPTEADSGELRVASSDIQLKAALSGVSPFNVGESTAMAWGTDERGNETDAALLLFQQSLDAYTRSRRWKYYILPKARVVPAPASMDENPAEDRYVIGPNPTTFHLWGTAMEGDTEGATEAGIIEGMAEGRPNIVAFKGDGATVAFLLPATKPAISAAKVAVWHNGVEVTTGGGGLASLTTTTVTFSVAPALDDVVVAYYEY